MITDFTNDYNILVGDVNSGRTGFNTFVTEWYLREAGYLGLRERIRLQETNQLLGLSASESLSAQTGRTTAIDFHLVNEYAYPATSITIDAITDPQQHRGITTSAVSVGSVGAGAKATVNLNVTVPANYFIYQTLQDNPFPHGDEIVPLRLTARWTVNGVNFTRQIEMPISVTSEGYITSVGANKYLVRPGEVVTLTFDWATNVPRSNLRAFALWYYPDGTLHGPINWTDVTGSRFSIDFVAPSGPYGAYGGKVLMYQSPDIVTIPYTYLNRLFYVAPNVSGGTLSQFTETSSAYVIYPSADRDAAEDIAQAMGIPNLYQLDGHSLAELQAIASAYNTVLVGGKFTNPLVEQLTQSGQLPDTLNQAGDAYIHVVPDAFSSRTVIVAAGYEARDTQIAAVSLADLWTPNVTCYALTLTHTGSGNDPVATPARSEGCSADGRYVAGEEITLIANPAPGNIVSGWAGTINDGSTMDTNLAVMPANDHSVSVSYIVSSVQVNSALALIDGSTAPPPIAYGTSISQSGAISGSGNGTITYRWEWRRQGTLAWTIGGTLNTSMNDGTALIDATSVLPIGVGNWDYRILTLTPNSVASNTLSVLFTATAGRPAIPVGPTGGLIGAGLEFTSSASTCPDGSEVEYQFDWGDGTQSDWSSIQTMTHTWSSAGLMQVMSRGRCVYYREGVSMWSAPLSVQIDRPSNGQVDTIGIFRASTSTFHLKFSNEAGIADISTNFGLSSDMPLSGDWDGDGIDTIGLYRPSQGMFMLNHQNTDGAPDIYILYGAPGDKPVVGDWDGDGIDTVAVYRGGVFMIINSHVGGLPTTYIQFGDSGLDTPLAGDWNNDNVDTPALWRPSLVAFFLTNQSASGAASVNGIIFYGTSNDIGFVGDWNADGTDGIGVYRPSNGDVYLRNTLSDGLPDIMFNYGIAEDKPLVGMWQLSAPDSPETAAVVPNQ